MQVPTLEVQIATISVQGAPSIASGTDPSCARCNTCCSLLVQEDVVKPSLFRVVMADLTTLALLPNDNAEEHWSQWFGRGYGQQAYRKDGGGGAARAVRGMGLFSKWKRGARCAVFWVLESVPEELWARGVVCPAEWAVILGATSKRVRALLSRMQRRVPAAVCVVGFASMDAVAGGLGGLHYER